jgi:hypothetical protein
MERDQKPGNRLTLSETQFKSLVDYLALVDSWRDTAPTSQRADREILQHYAILERFFWEVPPFRLSTAGITLGALTARDSQQKVIDNLKQTNLLEEEAIISIDNLSQQINFMRVRFHESNPEFNRFLANHSDNLPVEMTQFPEAYLTSLSIFWSASRSDEFRYQVTNIIGGLFRE